MMNYVQIPVRTSHYAIHLSVTKSDLFLDLGSPIPVKVLTWRRVSNSHLSEWKLILSLCVPGLLVSGDWPCTVWYSFPFILGISQLDCYFLRPLLIGKLKYFWSNDIPPFTQIFLNFYCEFYDGRQALEKCVMHLVVILMYKDGFEPRVPEG